MLFNILIHRLCRGGGNTLYYNYLTPLHTDISPKTAGRLRGRSHLIKPKYLNHNVLTTTN